MGTLYALLVGVDTYPDPAMLLHGAVNDIDRAEGYLRTRVTSDTPLAIRALRNSEATRAAVISAFVEHLGNAGPDDIAVFWYSGHGSWEVVPPEFRHLEPSGQLQTLVCYDSRLPGGRDLRDKELSTLVSRVAAECPHVALAIDACYSGGMHRTVSNNVLTARFCPPGNPVPYTELLPELTATRQATPTASAAPVVSLAACQPDQRAYEAVMDGDPPHGLFTRSLLRALARLGPDATYREVMSAAGGAVEDFSAAQVPVLSPASGPLVERRFLGGVLRAAATALVARYVRHEWRVDVGVCHGLPASSESLSFAVHGSDPVRELRALTVHTGQTTLEPVGWQPDRDTAYPLVLSRVPVPPVAVAVPDKLARAILTSGPGGRPSPYVRPAAPGEAAQLFVEGTPPQVVDDRGRPLTPPATAATLLSDLEHIGRWLSVRGLRSAASRLAGAMRIEVAAVDRDGPAMSSTGRDLGVPALAVSEPTTPAPSGPITTEYTWVNGAWRAPTVYIRLHNTTNRSLYCVLLDLTDQFEIHAELFPGEKVAPGRAYAANGGAIEFSLPEGRRVVPGAETSDWLLLLVAEEPFDPTSFRLPALGEAKAPTTRAPMADNAGLAGLGASAIYRTGRVYRPIGDDWTTVLQRVVTRVPMLIGRGG